MAVHRARRPKPAKLASNRRLRTEVEALLARRWSPAQIAARLRHDHPHAAELWVSAETIYQSLFVQGRGALRAELAALPAQRACPAPATGSRPGRWTRPDR